MPPPACTNQLAIKRSATMASRGLAVRRAREPHSWHQANGVRQCFTLRNLLPPSKAPRAIWTMYCATRYLPDARKGRPSSHGRERRFMRLRRWLRSLSAGNRTVRDTSLIGGDSRKRRSPAGDAGVGLASLSLCDNHKSSGVKPVCLAIRASIFGPISTPS